MTDDSLPGNIRIERQ